MSAFEQLIPATIRWINEQETEEQLFCIGGEPDGSDIAFDDRIFFYCPDLDEFEKLKDQNNGEDFYIIESGEIK